ncbi:PAS domain-containing sensor histidine kinase [Pseudodesulfovibrio pelocollis]|uniref:PAS domain-containing sensor histidine kinase n=1 Tax=Pseudodesulfovibrio pelocollis TaxID=3051432 RepID=UPI00255B2439|nr:PAS domain-containing hybrid sensor histidine kinase/response regulator [Pseudodesulfovibrio sp. SB368]
MSNTDIHSSTTNDAPHKTEAISENRQQEAILTAKALQDAIFNSANFSSIATDAKGVIQIFNVGAERMLGYTAAEVVDKITPADISDPQEVIARAKALSIELDTSITPGFEALVFKASRGIEDIYELTYIRKDGSRFSAVVSVTALRDVQGGIIGYLLIGTDNTSRKEVENERTKLDQRLRDQQFYTRSLFESNIDGLMATDPQGIVTDVNKQMGVLTGRTRDELVGAPFRSNFTDPVRAEAGINQVLAQGTITNYELTVRSLDGRETEVSLNATIFYDRDRRPLGVFAAARDIGERKKAEQLQQALMEASEASSRAKSEFLANMSHELRTPLNSIIGFAEVLQDQLYGKLGFKQLQYVETIHKAGQHLLVLIDDILDLAKIEAGKMELESSEFRLHDVLTHSMSMLSEKALKHGIQFSLDVAPETPEEMEADEHKFKQILFNLLSNAMKFTSDAGSVALRVRPYPPKAGWLEVEVQDTGIGISEADISKLFSEFTQLESPLEKKHQGTGLGLALTKRLVQAHGGDISVASEPGKGSTFSFRIPSRRENA